MHKASLLSARLAPSQHACHMRAWGACQPHQHCCSTINVAYMPLLTPSTTTYTHSSCKGLPRAVSEHTGWLLRAQHNMFFYNFTIAALYMIHHPFTAVHWPKTHKVQSHQQPIPHNSVCFCAKHALQFLSQEAVSQSVHPKEHAAVSPTYGE